MDAEEFSTFFKATTPMLLRYVSGMSDADVAQEIVAETMATIWTKHLDGPSTDESLRKLQGLAFRIADGHLLNHRRGDRRRSRLVGKLTNMTVFTASVQPDFTTLLQADAAVLARLDSLSPADRNVIALVIDGYSTAEIALMIRCNLSATKMRIFRARKELREALAGEAHHADER